MNNDELSATVRSLIVSGRSREAEERLLKERSEAGHSPDKGRLILVLDLLVQVYTVQESRDLIKADQICIEREQFDSSAFSKLQTGMLRYWAVRDYRGAIEKAEDAIAQGKMEHDDATVYSALSLLGLALIQVGDESKASRMLDEIEQMIEERRSIVVGDETLFLEAARSKRLNVETITRIAMRLAPVCGDPEFANRLRALAG